MIKRIGRQTVQYQNPTYLNACASIVGKKEGEGPLGELFDQSIEDERFGQDTFEQGERQFYLTAMETCMEKGGVKRADIDYMLGGDLLNQIICASFSARALSIPFLGLYGACSTMAESLCLGSMVVDGGFASNVLCAASSHYCTAERQYRFPLEFATQRTPTAQWTVTGAGAMLLSDRPGHDVLARVTHATVGRVVDLNITDANNMGAAMAPAACDTLTALFHDTSTQVKDYDLILTGDLGRVGQALLLELMENGGYPLDLKCTADCGLEIYQVDDQDMHAGGSGCGCSATVLSAKYLPMLMRGELKKIVFMATGALLSPTSSQQGDSIPGIAHAIVLQSPASITGKGEKQ